MEYPGRIAEQLAVRFAAGHRCLRKPCRSGCWPPAMGRWRHSAAGSWQPAASGSVLPSLLHPVQQGVALAVHSAQHCLLPALPKQRLPWQRTPPDQPPAEPALATLRVVQQLRWRSAPGRLPCWQRRQQTAAPRALRRPFTGEYALLLQAPAIVTCRHAICGGMWWLCMPAHHCCYLS